MVLNMSKSATTSPVTKRRQLLPPISFSYTNSPRLVRSNRYPRRLFHSEKIKEEARRLLMDGQQKLVILPACEGINVNRSGTSSNNKVITHRIKVCSTNSSDSSDEISTPSRHKRCKSHRRHPLQQHNRNGTRYSARMPINQYPCRGNGSSGKRTAVSDVAGNFPSLRSLKNNSTEGKSSDAAGVNNVLATSPSLSSFTYAPSDEPVTCLRPPSNIRTVRSLISIGMGSTDGKKLVIRKVPTSPADLLNFARTSPPYDVTEEDNFPSYSSFSGSFSNFDENSHKPRRRYWSNKLQFILACVGYSIGLGNLWRFPYLCYKSGGGVFLIPYFLVLFMCGIPLLYLELAIGQFTRRGPIGALSKLCPVFKGAGLSSVVVSFFLSTYYNVIIAYSLFYFFTAFRSEPPWDSCNNRWNSDRCWKSVDDLRNTSSSSGRPTLPKTPAEEFYTKKVLQMSNGFEEFGQMRWELVACSFIIGVLVYFALWKSVRSSGRVLYFTATVPFALVLIFLGHAVSLEGSDNGLKYLFSPNWKLLLDSRVWVYAAAQNFNSIGLAFGSVISFASYNKYNNQILHDTVTVSIINGITSLLVAVFAFAIIGNIASNQQESVENVISDGPGLIFVVYPEVFSKMPFSTFWSVLFFFTLLCLGLNSQFALVEVIVTSVQDGFPNWIKRKLICHEILVLVVCLTSFAIGLPNVFQGGIYFFQLIDYYVASVSIIYIAFFEVIAVTWIYGTARLSENLEKMTKRKPNFYFTYCWRIVTPLLLMSLWMISVMDYEPPTFENYHYPFWAELLGWTFTSVTMVSVPIFAVHVIYNSEGSTLKQKCLNSLKPRLKDYCNTYSEYSHEEHGKHIKELETLIEYTIKENNNKGIIINVPKTIKSSTHTRENVL